MGISFRTELRGGDFFSTEPRGGDFWGSTTDGDFQSWGVGWKFFKTGESLAFLGTEPGGRGFWGTNTAAGGDFQSCGVGWKLFFQTEAVLVVLADMTGLGWELLKVEKHQRSGKSTWAPDRCTFSTFGALFCSRIAFFVN